MQWPLGFSISTTIELCARGRCVKCIQFELGHKGLLGNKEKERNPFSISISIKIGGLLFDVSSGVCIIRLHIFPRSNIKSLPCRHSLSETIIIIVALCKNANIHILIQMDCREMCAPSFFFLINYDINERDDARTPTSTLIKTLDFVIGICFYGWS